MINSLMFAMIIIRSKIVYAMSIFNKYVESFKSQHVKTINRILIYIKKSLNLNIVYFSNNFRNNFRNNFFQDYCNLSHDEVINNCWLITE